MYATASMDISQLNNSSEERHRVEEDELRINGVDHVLPFSFNCRYYKDADVT